MHFKDDPISDMHAKNYLIILFLKHFPGPTKFGPVFWSRLFRRGPVEYNSMQDDSHPGCFVPESICTLFWSIHTLILVDLYPAYS